MHTSKAVVLTLQDGERVLIRDQQGRGFEVTVDLDRSPHPIIENVGDYDHLVGTSPDTFGDAILEGGVMGYGPEDEEVPMARIDAIFLR